MLRPYDVAEYRSGTCVTNAIGRGSEGQRRAQNLVTGAESADETPQMKGICAISDTYGIFGTQHLCEHLFQFGILRSGGNPTGLDGIIGGLRFAVVKIQVEKGYSISHTATFSDPDSFLSLRAQSSGRTLLSYSQHLLSRNRRQTRFPV